MYIYNLFFYRKRILNPSGRRKCIDIEGCVSSWRLIILHSSNHIPKPFVILQKILRKTCITVVSCCGLKQKNNCFKIIYLTLFLPDGFLKYMYSFLAKDLLQVAFHSAFQVFPQLPQPQQGGSPLGVLSLSWIVEIL